MLQPNGLLTVGRTVVTIDQIETTFVDGFPDSLSRRRIFDRWLEHREALASVIDIQAQWVDGSFVTAKMDPGDIDVVTLLSGEQYDALAQGPQAVARSLLSGPATRAQWDVDSYPLYVWPEGDARSRLTRKSKGYWTSLFTNQRHATEAKGFLEVTP